MGPSSKVFLGTSVKPIPRWNTLREYHFWLVDANGVYNQKHQPIVERIKTSGKAHQKHQRECSTTQHFYPTLRLGIKFQPKKVCFWWFRGTNFTPDWRIQVYFRPPKREFRGSPPKMPTCCGVGFGNWEKIHVEGCMICRWF